MTAFRDPDRMIRAFLDEGEEQLNDQVFDAVRAGIEQKRQRAFIGPWRTPIMNRFVTYGLGAAVVVVAGVFLGFRLLGSPATGGTGGAPSASPTPDSSTAAAAPTDFAALPMGRLDDGDYAFTHLPGVRVVFTASFSWEKNIPNWVVWSVDDDKATMGVSTVDNVAIDPCQPALGYQDPPVGPSVDDLVTALGAVPGLTLSAPAEVTQDGYSGVRLDYVGPDGLGNCLEDMSLAALMSVGGAVPSDEAFIAAPVGNDRVSLYIFDVDGTRVVIAAKYNGNRTAQLDEMLASIRFEKP